MSLTGGGAVTRMLMTRATDEEEEGEGVDEEERDAGCATTIAQAALVAVPCVP